MKGQVCQVSRFTFYIILQKDPLIDIDEAIFADYPNIIAGVFMLKIVHMFPNDLNWFIWKYIQLRKELLLLSLTCMMKLFMQAWVQAVKTFVVAARCKQLAVSPFRCRNSEYLLISSNKVVLHNLFFCYCQNARLGGGNTSKLTPFNGCQFFVSDRNCSTIQCFCITISSIPFTALVGYRAYGE